MNNFMTLYVFELRKIFKRKIVWITMGIMIVIAFYMGLGTLFDVYSVGDGQDTVEMNGFEYIANSKENDMSISGRKIDDAMIEEVKAAYQSTDAKKRQQYEAVYWNIISIIGEYDAIHNLTEETLYQERAKYQQSRYVDQKLTEEEMAYWLEKEAEIEKPFTYAYASGWQNILIEYVTLNVMVAITVAICLSNVFSEEHVRKTDQLILCSRYGKKSLFFSKMTAGITFGVLCAIILFICLLITKLWVYGAEGFDTVLQLYIEMSSHNLTIGQAIILFGVIYLICSIFYSVVTMFLSEGIKNSIAVMGLMTGSQIFATMFSVPEHFRVLSQIYESQPALLLGIWRFNDYRLVNVFGTYFTNFQVAPVIYLMICVVLVFWGNRLYKRYQVSGR